MYTLQELTEFLVESNAIEGVHDEVSLIQALKAWNYLVGQDVLTVKVILKTHKILMQYQNISPRYKGQFRDIPVYIGGKEAMPHEMITGSILMEFCFETMRKSPAPNWKALHIKYEKIHPFVDGNGRTGRMFMNWTRLKRCNLPILTIKSALRHDYYKWFE